MPEFNPLNHPGCLQHPARLAPSTWIEHVPFAMCLVDARRPRPRRATGEWVCLLGHDDRWLPRKLERQLEFARAHGCDIVCTDAFVLAYGAEARLDSLGFPEIARSLARRR